MSLRLSALSYEVKCGTKEGTCDGWLSTGFLRAFFLSSGCQLRKIHGHFQAVNRRFQLCHFGKGILLDQHLVANITGTGPPFGKRLKFMKS